MRAGDRVRFRAASRAWRAHGLAEPAQGVVLDIYRAALRGDLKVDVRFAEMVQPICGIDIDALEIVREGDAQPGRR